MPAYVIADTHITDHKTYDDYKRQVAPQIAKFGNHHYHIAKKVDDGRTRVAITLLSEPQRVEEIARMLGGVELTRATLDHARELVKR